VTNIMRDYIRNGAVGALAAFFLSLIVGLFSRNPAGTMFLRAFLLGVVFGGLAAAVTFLTKKYLLEQSGEASVRAEEKKSVDIVLPEESPGKGEGLEYTLEGPEEIEEAEPVEFGDGEMISESDTAIASRTPLSSEPGDFEEEIPEELAEETRPADGGEASGAVPVEEVGPIDVTGELDSLPDISELGSLGGGKSGPTPPRRTGPLAAKSSDEAVRGYLGDEDPESLAKAIRTVMKRDQKG
jgi:hypothetical protein